MPEPITQLEHARAGTITREEMIERAVTATRQYAKRQRTWFRGRMAEWSWI